MKKVKIALTSLTLMLAVAGVVVAKANEAKRLLQTQVFYQDSNNNWRSITASSSQFQASTGNQAAILDNSANQVLLYTSQSTSNPAEFVKP